MNARVTFKSKQELCLHSLQSPCMGLSPPVRPFSDFVLGLNELDLKEQSWRGGCQVVCR